MCPFEGFSFIVLLLIDIMKRGRSRWAIAPPILLLSQTLTLTWSLKVDMVPPNHRSLGRNLFSRTISLPVSSSKKIRYFRYEGEG